MDNSRLYKTVHSILLKENNEATISKDIKNSPHIVTNCFICSFRSQNCFPIVPD